MAGTVRAGDVLAGRYRMVDLLVEADGAWLWNAHDQLLHRPVSVHVLPVDDVRADAVIGAARRSATLTDPRTLRVLDCNRTETLAYVVNEWGKGTSLDVALIANGPLAPARAAWLVAETADTIAATHAAGAVHGRLVPENVLIDENGSVRVIGSGVEAALMGHLALPSDDVRNLVALLHAALTGRWAGVPGSQIQAAPVENGRVLRPRQVRPGIPRPLDQMCDQGLNGSPSPTTGSIPIPALSSVLGGRDPHDLTTAAGLRDALEEFLGEYQPDLLAHATHSSPIRPAGLTPAPWHVPPVDDAEPDAAAPLLVDTELTPVPAVPLPADPAAEADEQPEPGDPALPSAVTAPTEAGLPVFDDAHDDIDWIRTHNPERPAPEAPPAPEPRPLFAPESDDLARRRHQERQGTHRREDAATDTGSGAGPASAAVTGSTPPRLPDDFWSFDTTGHGLPLTGTTSGTIEPIDAAGSPVPGRLWMRLAWGVGIAALVLLVIGVVLHPADEKDPAPKADPTPTVTPSPSVTGPVDGLVATDLDPADSAAEEYPEDTPKAVDGDVATYWGTSTYLQQFGPGGLKDGVGLVVDLGEERNVRTVEVDVTGGTHTVQLFLTDDEPTGVAGLELMGEAIGDGTLELTPPESATGRYAIVWLTQLPVQDGGYRGKIAEIRVTA